MSDSRNTDIVNWPANLVILLDILVYERRNILLCRVRSAHQPKKDGARSADYFTQYYRQRLQEKHRKNDNRSLLSTKTK